MNVKNAGKICDAVFEAGVVGSGGAGFPTHIKLQNQAELVIANGVECEPLLYHDKHIMEDRPADVLKGLRAAMQAVGAKRGVVVLKENYIQHVGSKLDKSLKKSDRISIMPIEDYYPAGDEQEVVRAVTKKRVPPGKIPLVLGIVVCNVTTLVHITEALEGKAVTNRPLSIVGDIANPCTVEVPIGMILRDIFEMTGNVVGDDRRVLVGGVMMGSPADLNDSIDKTTTGLVVLPIDHPRFKEFDIPIERMLRQSRSVCFQCQSCCDVCPRYLLGHPISPHRNMRSFATMKSMPQSALLCSECGLCSLVGCSAGISPRILHRYQKQVLMTEHPQHREWQLREEHPIRRFRHISSHRLKEKLQITGYDCEPVRFTGKINPNSLKINLKQHIGIKANPEVKSGQNVKEGELLGSIQRDKVGAQVHSSMSGRIDSISGPGIFITTVER